MVAGDDYLEGGSGTNYLYGGDGNDNFVSVKAQIIWWCR